jgi:hypothetical protein
MAMMKRVAFFVFTALPILAIAQDESARFDAMERRLMALES